MRLLFTVLKRFIGLKDSILNRIAVLVCSNIILMIFLIPHGVAQVSPPLIEMDPMIHLTLNNQPDYYKIVIHHPGTSIIDDVYALEDGLPCDFSAMSTVLYSDNDLTVYGIAPDHFGLGEHNLLVAAKYVDSDYGYGYGIYHKDDSSIVFKHHNPEFTSALKNEIISHWEHISWNKIVSEVSIEDLNDIAAATGLQAIFIEPLTVVGYRTGVGCYKFFSITAVEWPEIVGRGDKPKVTMSCTVKVSGYGIVEQEVTVTATGEDPQEVAQALIDAAEELKKVAKPLGDTMGQTSSEANEGWFIGVFKWLLDKIACPCHGIPLSKLIWP